MEEFYRQLRSVRGVLTADNVPVMPTAIAKVLVVSVCSIRHVGKFPREIAVILAGLCLPTASGHFYVTVRHCNASLR